MNQERFDDLTRALATKRFSRWQVLKHFGAALVLFGPFGTLLTAAREGAAAPKCSPRTECEKLWKDAEERARKACQQGCKGLQEFFSCYTACFNATFNQEIKNLPEACTKEWPTGPSCKEKEVCCNGTCVPCGRCESCDPATSPCVCVCPKGETVCGGTCVATSISKCKACINDTYKTCEGDSTCMLYGGQ